MLGDPAEVEQQVKTDDVASVVLFDSAIESLAEPARMRDQHALAKQLKLVQARGCTNLSGGWLRGRDHMQQAAHIMSVTMSCDHRAIDGALGAELIGAFRRLIENPVMMMV